jgi:hypothetical protein
VTVSRPGVVAREPDVLETREPRRPVPSWLKFVGVILALLALVAVNAAAASRDRARDARAEDIVDLRVSSGGAGTTIVRGTLLVSFALDNRGPALRFEAPTLDPPLFPLVPAPPPNPVAARAAGLLALEVRPSCDVAARTRDPIALRMLLPAVPPSGRRHVVPVQLDADALVDAALQVCGLAGPARAAQPEVTRVGSGADEIAFELSVRNTSRRALRVSALRAPGLALHVDGGLPVPVPPGQTERLRVQASVVTCSLVATALSEQQTGSLGIGAFEIELVGVYGNVEPLVFRSDPGSPLYTAWSAYVTRHCGKR